MLSLRIALRYLFSRKSHNSVNIISIISIAGVAVATMAIVCVLSVFNGFSGLAAGRLSAISPDIRILPAKGKVMTGADSLASRLDTLGCVSLAVPTLSEQALAIFRNAQLPVRVTGVTDGYSKVVSIDSAVIDGSFMLHEPYGYPTAAVSIGAAMSLATRPNAYEPLALYAPKRVGRINPAAPMSAFSADSVLVSAVWQTEEADIDAASIIVPMEIARNLFDYTGSEASSIEVALTPGADPVAAKKQIAALAPDTIVLTRPEQYDSSFKMISVEKWITFLMLAFILLIAAFNVVSTLSMMIIEKRNDMRTLMKLGARRSMIGRIFLWEGWLISVTGGAAGIIIGLALCAAQQYGGFIKLNGDPTQLTISSYPVVVQASDILVVAALVMAVGLIVGSIASALSRR